MRRAAVRALSTLAIPALALGAAPRCEADKPLAIPLQATYAPPPSALSPAEFRPLRVSRTEQLTHNTRRLTLEFPREGDDAGLVPASCVAVRLDVDGKPAVRAYTPVSRARTRGSMDLIVKAYPTGVGKCVRGGGTARSGRPRALRCAQHTPHPPSPFASPQGPVRPPGGRHGGREGALSKAALHGQPVGLRGHGGGGHGRDAHVPAHP
jgi:hypothetical protein